jgi:hypothetical protein
MNAVLLYARATATNGQPGERGPIQIDDKKLTPEQRVDHKILLEIRNCAQAHVYRQQDIGSDLWHDDVVFAVEVPGSGWKPAVASQRIYFHLPTFNRLMSQLPIVKGLLHQKFLKRIGAVSSRLNDTPVPVALYRAHEFDPIARLGGVKAVEAVLAGIGPGFATVYIK